MANRVKFLLILLIFLVVVSTIVLGSVPPIDRDGLTHHLYIPKLYINKGEIYEIPQSPFSYYPMNLDLLYIIPLYFHNDIFPKYIHYFFAILTALVIYKYLRKHTTQEFSLLGSIFLLTTPIIIKLSISAYVDLGLMFFSTLSWYFLFNWIRNTEKYYFLLFSGIACGLCLGTKYNGIVTLLILCLLLPIFYTRSIPKLNKYICFLHTFVFLFISITAASPWYIRNFFWTGNPVFPLYNDTAQSIASNINNPDKALTSIKEDHDGNVIKSNVFVTRKILYQEKWWQTLLLPVSFFINGKDDDPRFFDGKLNPFLLILPLFAFLIRSSYGNLLNEKIFLLVFSFLTFFYMFFLYALRVRYVICMVPPLVTLSILGLYNIYEIVQLRISAYRKTAPFLLIALTSLCFLSYNFYYGYNLFKKYDPFSYISGTVSRDDYIARYVHEYPAVQFINNISEAKKILVFFTGNRGYYFNKEIIFDKAINKSLFSNAVESASDINDLKTFVTTNGFTHFLIRNDLFSNWINQSFSYQKKELIINFFKSNAVNIYFNNGYSVYSIK